MHHSSGPTHTDLLDPQFAEKLAEYARQVAERYTWIDAYTPVNEPNTTARFSGLYGLWYPHHLCRASYLRALRNQVRGTVLNLRQWLTFDLLCGTVDRDHPMFAYMRAEQISEEDIHWFAENACPPDVMGVNYYLTSDRYLDHRVELYPSDRMSAEGDFVDVEAVRVLPERVVDVSELLQEAWNRYGLPVAITEVHLGCSVNEQIRWFAESWEGLLKARRRDSLSLV